MKRYGVLLGCVGVVALIGMAANCQLAPLRGEKAGIAKARLVRSGQVREDLARPRSEQPKGGRSAVGAGVSRHLELKTLRVTPELYVDMTDPPRFPCWVPDVRGFHPYPECEIVGMPFAGVKMCE